MDLIERRNAMGIKLTGQASFEHRQTWKDRSRLTKERKHYEQRLKNAEEIEARAKKELAAIEARNSKKGHPSQWPTSERAALYKAKFALEEAQGATRNIRENEIPGGRRPQPLLRGKKGGLYYLSKGNKKVYAAKH